MARKRSTTPHTGKPRRRAPTPAAAPTAAAAADQYLVYVHGICAHSAGYSDPWWAALKPYVTTVPDANRKEVLWSDVITPAAAPAAQPMSREERFALRLTRAQAPTTADPRATALAAQVMDVLADRVQQQQLVAAAAPGPGVAPAAAALGPASAQNFLVAEAAAPLPFLGLPDFECISDFMSYLLNNDIRTQVMDRFAAVVEPLLAAGSEVHVISHSWGTVVAYEALRRMDGAHPEYADGSVLNLFTVGSALAIAPVKRNLLPSDIDGRRPRLVRTWVNLDARFDVVGGPLSGNPFQVDAEYLNLPPVGCSMWIPNPVCAHGSYFQAANVTVNEGIFGKYMSG